MKCGHFIVISIMNWILHVAVIVCEKKNKKTDFQTIYFRCMCNAQCAMCKTISKSEEACAQRLFDEYLTIEKITRILWPMYPITECNRMCTVYLAGYELWMQWKTKTRWIAQMIMNYSLINSHYRRSIFLDLL